MSSSKKRIVDVRHNVILIPFPLATCPLILQTSFLTFHSLLPFPPCRILHPSDLPLVASPRKAPAYCWWPVHSQKVSTYRACLLTETSFSSAEELLKLCDSYPCFVTLLACPQNNSKHPVVYITGFFGTRSFHFWSRFASFHTFLSV
jgi:hypothetical protein